MHSLGTERLVLAPHFAPPLGGAALLVFGLAAGLAVLLALHRRARGGYWRAGALAVLVAWLAGPAIWRQSLRPLGDIGVLLIDRSASMRIGDRAALAEAAAAAIRAQAARHPGLALRVVEARDPGEHGTLLFAALDRALADIPPDRYAGTIAITDGEAGDIPARAPPGAPPGAPFHLLIPARGEQTDRVVRILSAPAYGIVGKSVTLKLAVADLGAHDPGAHAVLTILREGAKPLRETVTVGAPIEVAVPIRRAGRTVVAFTASPLAGEVSTENNTAVATITGVRDRLRVLLVSGSPHRGERSWRRLLAADPAVDLVHFTILRPPDKVDLTPITQLALIPFPVDELFAQRIGRFDLIILDRFADPGLLPLRYLENVAAYVRAGGALLVTAGPEFARSGTLAETPLRPVLPAVPAGIGTEAVRGALAIGRFRPKLTEAGARAPVTAGLPGANDPTRPDAPPGWGAWYRRIRPAETRGEVLMAAPDGAPLLLLDRVGSGRVALLLSDQIWLWARGHDGGGPEAALLRRLAHWLMKEPALEENALDARVAGGRLTVRRRRLKGDAQGQVTVTAPDGTTRKLALARIAPGLAEASMAAAAPGLWRVGDGKRTAFAAAAPADPAEYADLRATARKLGTLTRGSGGAVVWLGGAGAPTLRRVAPGAATAGPGWIGLVRRGDAAVTGIATVTLLPGWAALALILGLSAIAWWREGR